MTDQEFLDAKAPALVALCDQERDSKNIARLHQIPVALGDRICHLFHHHKRTGVAGFGG